MYIRTDENNNIIELIIVGVKPEVNGYEIDSIPEDIMRDILNYKYIEGEFIKSDEDIRNKYIDQIRRVKLDTLSSICNTFISAGIDYNDEHYSLTTTDQINLMKLESIARFSPETPILYHADGKDCRVYSNEEILQIATMGIGLITFHTTYYNQLKSQVNGMTNVDDIINVKYGMKLDEVHETQFRLLTSGFEFPLIEIEDPFDYDSLIPSVDQHTINAAMKPTEIPPEVSDNDKPIIEPWKPNKDAYITDDNVVEDSTPYEPDIETNVDDHNIEDMVIPDTSTEVEWVEEPSDESEEVTDEETDTELPV